MVSGKSRKKIWKEYVPFRMCPCCGKDIVLLRLPGWGRKDDPRWYIACYVKGWDRNPWFVGGSPHAIGNAVPHPRKRYAQRMYPRKEESPKDPLFVLDV